jgi:TRAP-type C4-dicarboxylate transport system permease small subunit
LELPDGSVPVKKIEAILKNLVLALEALSMSLIFLCVILQVTFRFVLQSPLPWPEELSRIIFIYLVFIGAAEASRVRSHIAIDVMDVFRLSARSDRYLGIVRNVLVLIVLAIMGHGAYLIIPIGYNMYLPATGLPMSVMSAPVLIGSILMFIWTAIHLGRDCLALKTRS